ncbi:protein kinase, partial [bacterium]|nr:protein kinase [bacterium]
VKPSNIFLTRHGAKLLDFGLARIGSEAFANTQQVLTRPGTALGTPRYMAPEQWSGTTAGPEADLWAAGVVLFEMLAGRPAFDGTSIGELYEAITNREPPALSGGPAIVAADRVVQHALEKQPQHRYRTAIAMAEDVRALASSPASASSPALARATLRLIVLPFRVLRPDPDIDFLSVSLPDAISGALASIDSLVVRSRRSAATSVEDSSIRAIAKEAGVDAVLSGTLMCAGGRVRVAAELAEAPSGTVRWSKTVDGTLEDLFALQDSIVREILDSLTISLSAPERGRLERGTPADPRAYELYLRGNDVAVSWIRTASLLQARDLYRAALDAEPGYAPAWARLARVYRIMSKYGHGDTAETYHLATEAMEKAFELDPDLSIAHHYVTYFEVEDGNVLGAMRRLITRAKERGNDPDAFAGLVVVLRFCGLLDESEAAHDRARRLDPHIRTGVAYTYYLRGDWERAIEADDETPPYCRFRSLQAIGRDDEAAALLRAQLANVTEGGEAQAVKMSLAAMEGDRRAVRQEWDRISGTGFRDPEGWFFMAQNVALVGELDVALERLQWVVDRGFFPVRALEEMVFFESLRGESEFWEIVDRAREGSDAARAEFLRLGGPAVLGLRA